MTWPLPALLLEIRRGFTISTISVDDSFFRSLFNQTTRISPWRISRKSWQGDVTIVTQNIDNLHERAGADKVIHIHGELLHARCNRCEKRFPCQQDLSTADKCSICDASGVMRPDVVWFGEMPMHMEAVDRLLETADLFMSIGTSGNVYPAAGFVEIARAAGAHTVELNLEKSAGASSFDEAIYGPATKVVKGYVERLLENPHRPPSQ